MSNEGYSSIRSNSQVGEPTNPYSHYSTNENDLTANESIKTTKQMLSDNSENNLDTNLVIEKSDESDKTLPKTSKSMLSIDTIDYNTIENEIYNLHQFDNLKTKSNLTSSIINLSNTILGAGLLGLPYAIGRSGYLVSLIMFAIFGVLSSLGLHLNMFAASKIKNSSYNRLSQATLPQAKYIVNIAVFLKCFGVGTSYLVVIGDLMPDAIHKFSEKKVYDNRQLWITIFLVVIIIPFVRFRDIDALKFTSGFALMCFTYVVTVIIIYGAPGSSFDACSPFDDKKECKGEISAVPSKAIAFIRVFPIYIFAFTCHQNCFSICNELVNNSMKRLNLVVVCSVLLCTVVYLLIGLFGYFTFGNNVKSDILTSYPNDTWVITILRILLSIALGWSYPLQCHPARKCLSNLIFKKEIFKISKPYFYMLTYGIVLISYLISMVVHDLGIMLALVGGTGSTVISYILPGTFFYYMFKNDPKQYFRNKLAIAMITFGVIVMPFALTIELIEAI